jgi:cytochrome c oxidase subunit 4
MKDAGMSEQDKQDEDEMHIVSPGVYVAVGVALLVLTGTTVGVSYIDLGVFNAVVALGIAVIKMMLVVLFFMHVKYSPRLTKLTVLAGVFVFIVLVGMTLTDYVTRAWGRW